MAILFNLIQVALSFILVILVPTTGADDASGLIDIVVIDVLSDLSSNPEWRMSPDCTYYENLPQSICGHSVDQNYSGIGFWGESCDRLCSISYERKPEESILKVELVSHYGYTDCPGWFSTAINAYLDNNGDFQMLQYPPNMVSDFREIVADERIQSIDIRMISASSCPSGGFHLLDKIILHKKINPGPLISTIDTELDIPASNWKFTGGCMYQSNYTNFICDGRTPTFPVVNGQGFWIGCESWCYVQYDRLPGEILNKLEIGGLFDDFQSVSVYICRKYNQRCIQFRFNEDGGYQRYINFKDYVISEDDQIESIQIMLPSQHPHPDARTNVMLDKLILHKSYSENND